MGEPALLTEEPRRGVCTHRGCRQQPCPGNQELDKGDAGPVLQGGEQSPGRREVFQVQEQMCEQGVGGRDAESPVAGTRCPGQPGWAVGWEDGGKQGEAGHTSRVQGSQVVPGSGAASTPVELDLVTLQTFQDRKTQIPAILCGSIHEISKRTQRCCSVHWASGPAIWLPRESRNTSVPTSSTNRETQPGARVAASLLRVSLLGLRLLTPYSHSCVCTLFWITLNTVGSWKNLRYLRT